MQRSDSDPNMAFVKAQLDLLGAAPKRQQRTPAEQQMARQVAMQRIAAADVSFKMDECHRYLHVFGSRGFILGQRVNLCRFTTILGKTYILCLYPTFVISSLPRWGCCVSRSSSPSYLSTRTLRVNTCRVPRVEQVQLTLGLLPQSHPSASGTTPGCMSMAGFWTHQRTPHWMMTSLLSLRILLGKELQSIV